MRFLGLAVSVVIFSAGFASAQTGFATASYANVLPATSDNTQLLSADLNGDGRPDLVSYGSRNGASTVPGNVFLNNGDGSFGAPTPLPGQGLLASAAIADMNGDGYPDIVGCENVGSGQTQAISVIVYLNNGNGTFKALPAVSGSGDCNSLTLGDFYHTGHIAVVTMGYTPGQYGPGGQFYPGITTTMDIYENNGTGTLTNNTTASFTDLNDPNTSSMYTNCGAIDVVGGDFLNNGNFDLIVTTTCQPTGQTLAGYAGTTFYLAQTQDQYGNWSYSTVTHLQSAPEIYTHGQAVMDLNGNGRLDALFLGQQTSTEGDLIEAVNNGGENFTFNKLDTQTYFEGAAVADFNGDGLDDISTTYDPNVSNGAPAGPPMLAILAGTTSGTFTTSQSFATGSAQDLGGGIVTADFNGDGKPDMATLVYDTSTRTTSLNVYLNTQNGSSQPCSAPSTANTNIICSPTAGETVNSPVTVNAASNVTGFTANRLYLDNNAVYFSNSQQVSTTITAATGPHHLVLVSYNNKGQAFTSGVDFTVGNQTNGCIPSSGGVMICSPVNGQTYNSPVTVTAGARAQVGTLTAMRVYIDNAAVYTISAPTGSTTFQFTENLGVYAGSHHLVVVGYESTGGAVTNSLDFNVPSGPCTASTSGSSLRICSPNETMTLSSPITVSAGAYTSSGYIAAMRIYIDNAAVALLNNPNKSQSFTISQQEPVASGKHNLVVVGYPSTGGSVSGQEEITVK